jgi:hypothetical protein
MRTEAAVYTSLNPVFEDMFVFEDTRRVNMRGELVRRDGVPEESPEGDFKVLYRRSICVYNWAINLTIAITG